MNNASEYKKGADPSNVDTDGDGLKDGEDENPLVPLVLPGKVGSMPLFIVVLLGVLALRKRKARF